MKGKLTKEPNGWWLWDNQQGYLSSTPTTPILIDQSHIDALLPKEFDVKEYANKYAREFPTDYIKMVELVYTKGFNKALELTKERKFTKKDLAKLWIDVAETVSDCFVKSKPMPKGSFENAFSKLSAEKKEYDCDYEIKEGSIVIAKIY